MHREGSSRGASRGHRGVSSRGSSRGQGLTLPPTAPKYIILNVNLVHHPGKRLEPSRRVHTTPMHLGGICEAPRRSILRFEGAVNTLFTPPGDSGGRSDRGYRHLQLSCAARRARHCIRIMSRDAKMKSVPATVHGEGVWLHNYPLSALRTVRHSLLRAMRATHLSDHRGRV